VIEKHLIEDLKQGEFKTVIDSLDSEVASKVVHQSLRLLSLKYPQRFDKIAPYYQVLDENRY
jgi:hypothetical protein